VANAPFDRTILNFREKPLSSDINQAQSQMDYALRLVAQNILGSRTSVAGGTYGTSNDGFSPNDGFLPGSFRVLPSAIPDMNVTVKAGTGFVTDAASNASAINGIGGLDDLCSYKPLVLVTDTVMAVPVAPGVGNSRIDIIEVRTNRLTNNPNSRLILDPATGVFNPDMVDKTLNWALDGSTGSVLSPAPSVAAISYKQGVAALTGTELEPATTTGYTKIARINVGPLATTIDLDDLVDSRRIIFPGNMVPFAWSGRIDFNAGAPLVFQGGANPGSIQGPPDIRMTMAPGGATRGVGTLFLVGGAIRAISANISSTPHQTAGAGEFALTTWGSGTTSNDWPTPANAGDQALALAVGQPPLSFGVGSSLVRLAFTSRYQAAGVTNNTDVLLEQLFHRISGFISY
jgi:hypothetical protein